MRPLPRWMLIAGEILLAAILLGYYAWFNRYPLLYSDTGAHIQTGFMGYAPPDRPIGYGLFIRHFSLAETLWFAMMAQLLWVAATLRIWLSYYLPKPMPGVVFLLFCIVLCVTSNIGVTAPMMIPDIFFGMLLLNVMLFVRKDVGIKTRSFLIISTLIMLSFHSALPVLLMGVALGFSVILFLRKEIQSQWKTLASLALISVFGWLFISVSNYTYRDEFVYSPGSHAFLINRLRDADVLSEYLEERCPEEDYELCNYRDELFGDFLWDVENSPFHKMGGWEKTRDEYNTIIRDIVTSPYYLKKLVFNGVFTGMSQLFSYEQGIATSQYAGGPDYAIRDRFDFDRGQFYGARQQISGLDLHGFNPWNLGALLAFIAYAIVAFYRRNQWKGVLTHSEILLVSFFMIANAYQSAILSGVVDRYGARMLWVLAMIILAEVFTRLLNKKPWQQWLNL